MPGDGDSPGSAFHLGEVVESFLSQPLLAGLPPPAAALPHASPLRTWPGSVSALTYHLRPSSLSTCARSSPWARSVPQTDGTARTDIDALVPYRQNKHVLLSQQEGRRNGRRSEFPFRVLEVDRIIPRGGGQDNIENLQLLFAHCNRVKGDRPQEYLVAKLRELGIAA